MNLPKPPEDRLRLQITISKQVDGESFVKCNKYSALLLGISNLTATARLPGYTNGGALSGKF